MNIMGTADARFQPNSGHELGRLFYKSIFSIKIYKQWNNKSEYYKIE